MGNEKADEMAKKGITADTTTDVLPPLCHTKLATTEAALAEWQHDWTSYNGGRQTKQFFPTLDKKKSSQLLTLSKTQLGRLTRLISGHNNLNYHMSLCNPGHTSLCRLCKTERETFFHFITDCPVLLNTRQTYLSYWETNEVTDWNMDRILSFSYVPVVNDAIEFYSNTDEDMWSEVPTDASGTDNTESEDNNEDANNNRMDSPIPQQPTNQVDDTTQQEEGVDTPRTIATGIG